MANMLFSSADIYPTLANKSSTETTLESSPDREDLEALGEDSSAEIEGKQARGSAIAVAIIIIFALVVFFGIN